MYKGWVKSGADGVYKAVVYTALHSASKDKGTDDDVSLTVHGTKGSTSPAKLDKWYKDDLEAGSVETYPLKGDDVGTIQYITVEKVGKDNWLLDKVTIVHTVTGHETTFPYFDWLEGTQIIAPGNALLPSQETVETLKKHRQDELVARQKAFRFRPGYTGVPGFIDAATHDVLPKFVQFHDQKKHDFKANFEEAKKKFGISSIVEKLFDWEKPSDLADMITRFTWGEDLETIKYYAKTWDDDTQFGNLVLNGPNPAIIERCHQLPSNFPVTDEIVKSSLQRELTLQQEIEAGHVYILNYKDLEGISRFQEGDDVRHCANAIVLLYVRPSGHLVPVAIKLDQDDGPIWTPEDGLGWTLAKIYAKNCDVQIHQMSTHLLCAHFVSEAVGVALLRNFSSRHPIYKLLVPHMKFTVAINTVGREKLTAPGAVADKTLSISGNGAHLESLSRRYRHYFHWDMLNVPNFFTKRGVDNVDLLPNYHYREDALRLWAAILDYVTQVVSAYYKVDNDVINDTELQCFMKDLNQEAYPCADGELDKQCPSSANSLEDLHTILTMVIFNGSCQHAAVNFCQFQVMGFCPNLPFILRQPPPKSKWDVKMTDIMAALPGKMQCVAQAAITYALSRYTDTEIYLGLFPEEYFTEDAPKQAQAAFKRALEDISEQIKKRNATAEYPYIYLLPERTPSSIAT